jgi:endoglucanase
MFNIFLHRLVILFLVFSLIFIPIQSASASTNYLHTSGNRILDSANAVIGFSGLNWFGFESTNHAPHGLWARNWQEMLDQIKSLGYNVIRLPFSDAMLDPSVMPNGIDYTKNPDLINLNSLQLMDRIIAGAQARGIRIILDNHRSSAGNGPDGSGLWYASNYSESRWIEDWKMLANRYKGNDAVIGMDLRNEPFNACWGCSDSSKDWRLAAEKAGNAILSVNPDLLIIVEGIAIYNNQSTWWGGNLIGAKDFPIRLNVENHLVYSPHEYPASVYPQSWFSDPNYPNNLPSVWDKYWGYLSTDTPILIGEFGSKLETDKDRQWFQAFQSYIKSKQLNWTFWALNPDSGDTGGLLLDDWQSMNTEKQAGLKTIQYPLIGSVSQLPTPTSTLNPTPALTNTPTPINITTLVLDDFESGNLQSWNSFQATNSTVMASLISLGQIGTYAMKVDYNLGANGWAGVAKSFSTSQNWSPYQKINFRFYGMNSGSTIRFEVLDNRAAGSSVDTSERFEYKFTDNFTGWKTFDLPWNSFTRRADWQLAGAPNDGFNLTSVWGFNFAPINGKGSFLLDQIQLIGALNIVSSIFVDNFETGNISYWNIFRDSNSVITKKVTSPGRSSLYALGIDYGIAANGWGGAEARYFAAQDWSGTTAFDVWFYGGNTGNPIRLELYENRVAGSLTDTSERFEYRIVDSWSGWKHLTIPWSSFTHRTDWQPQGAPNDGFSRTQIWGFDFSPLSGQGSFQVDDIQLLKP